MKYPSFPAVNWAHPSDVARLSINAYGLLESETGSISTVVGARVTKCACEQCESRLFNAPFFFWWGGFPTTLKSGHRDIPYFHDWNIPPQP